MSFINHTNHASKFWSREQMESALKYGEVIDLPFPEIDPIWTTAEIDELAEEYKEKILSYQPAAVMCQGEFVYTYHLIEKLKQAEICVVAACSERQVIEVAKDDGTTEKRSVFQFIQFREY